MIFSKLCMPIGYFIIAAVLNSFGKDTKNNDMCKGIARKNNEIAKYHICGIADKEKNNTFAF